MTPRPAGQLAAGRWVRFLFAAAVSFALLASAAVAADSPRRPQISAPSAVLVDSSNGSVLFARQARRRRPIASATKLMTALISLERLPLRRKLRAQPYQAAAAESRINLRPGERMTVADLLRALLLESANDAAVTLAHGAAGSVRGFVKRMNARARRLGLRDTHYSNPVGFDEPGNYSSALDLSRLARRLLGNDTFASIVDMPRARLLTGARPRVVNNRNRLVGRVPWVDGVKTGHTTSAGYVLIASGKRKGVRLLSAVLGASSEAERDSESLALLDYGFSLYRRVRVIGPGERLARADVAFYGDRKVGLTTAHGVTLTVRRGERVRVRIKAPGELEGPLDRGQRVGSVSVLEDGQLARVLPLVTAESVPGAGVVRKAVHDLLRPWLLLVIVAGLGIALGRRRSARKGGRPSRRVVT